jgi:ribulose-phosphate 3-epimerase
VMTVNPGFGGQAYIATMEPKIREAADMIEKSGLTIDLEVDGGISPDTIAGAASAGARVFIAGSALYKHAGGLTDAVSTLRRLAEEALAA